MTCSLIDLKVIALSICMFLFLFNLQTLLATHVSEPILVIDPKIQYKKNQTISTNGWVEYNNQPASDVLVLIRLTNPDSDEIFREEIRSDSNGNFSASINLAELNLTEMGAYRITAESQCRDVHRSICNHNSTSQIVQVIN
jgi:hypothetical protein